MRRPALFLLLLLLVTCGGASAQHGADGTWVLALGTRNFLVLTLINADSGPVTGSLSLPSHFQTADGISFSHVSGDISTQRIVRAAWKQGQLSLTVQAAENPSDKSDFVFSLKDNDHAELQIEGAPMPPFLLVRSAAPVEVAKNWEDAKVYSPDDGVASNTEMKRIFDEDQSVRQGATLEWSVIRRTDAGRRAATKELLNQGALHSGEDFIRAAFVFQHGTSADDYLLAHALAMVAMKKGAQDAVWIASATLDRYLQTMHQPQIFGTQYTTINKQPATQEPYSRTLVSDALRRELMVAVQEEQEKKRTQYDIERGLVK